MRPALLVIDVENIYTQKGADLACEGAATTISNINKLIGQFVSRRWPKIFIRHIHKANGSDLGRMFDYTGEPEDDFNFKAGTADVEYDSRLEIPEDAVHLIKNRYSAFSAKQLDAQLRQLQVDTVVVCGFMTNFCCDSTAREAHDRDYWVDFVSDATGTPGTESMNQKELRKVVGSLLGEGYARVHSTRSFLASLTRN